MTIREKIKELNLKHEYPVIEPIWMDYEVKKVVEFPDSYMIKFVDELWGYHTQIIIDK